MIYDTCVLVKYFQQEFFIKIFVKRSGFFRELPAL